MRRIKTNLIGSAYKNLKNVKKALKCQLIEILFISNVLYLSVYILKITSSLFFLNVHNYNIFSNILLLNRFPIFSLIITITSNRRKNILKTKCNFCTLFTSFCCFIIFYFIV